MDPTSPRRGRRLHQKWPPSRTARICVADSLSMFFPRQLFWDSLEASTRQGRVVERTNDVRWLACCWFLSRFVSTNHWRVTMFTNIWQTYISHILRHFQYISQILIYSVFFQIGGIGEKCFSSFGAPQHLNNTSQHKAWKPASTATVQVTVPAPNISTEATRNASIGAGRSFAAWLRRSRRSKTRH